MFHQAVFTTRKGYKENGAKRICFVAGVNFNAVNPGYTFLSFRLFFCCTSRRERFFTGISNSLAYRQAVDSESINLFVSRRKKTGAKDVF